MKYNRKSKSIILKSIVVLVGFISCVIFLGGCNAKTNKDVDYGNYKYGFTIKLFKDFSENIEIIENEKVIYFANKEIRAANPENILGVVGRIEVYNKKEFTKENMKQNEDTYNLRYLGENDNYYFGWAHATDVQFPANTSKKLKEKYKTMEKEFDEIIKTFKTLE